MKMLYKRNARRECQNSTYKMMTAFKLRGKNERGFYKVINLLCLRSWKLFSLKGDSTTISRAGNFCLFCTLVCLTESSIFSFFRKYHFVTKSKVSSSIQMF